MRLRNGQKKISKTLGSKYFFWMKTNRDTLIPKRTATNPGIGFFDQNSWEIGQYATLGAKQKSLTWHFFPEKQTKRDYDKSFAKNHNQIFSLSKQEIAVGAFMTFSYPGKPWFFWSCFRYIGLQFERTYRRKLDSRNLFTKKPIKIFDIGIEFFYIINWIFAAVVFWIWGNFRNSVLKWNLWKSLSSVNSSKKFSF